MKRLKILLIIVVWGGGLWRWNKDSKPDDDFVRKCSELVVVRMFSAPEEQIGDINTAEFTVLEWNKTNISLQITTVYNREGHLVGNVVSCVKDQNGDVKITSSSF